MVSLVKLVTCTPTIIQEKLRYSEHEFKSQRRKSQIKWNKRRRGTAPWGFLCSDCTWSRTCGRRRHRQSADPSGRQSYRRPCISAACQWKWKPYLASFLTNITPPSPTPTRPIDPARNRSPTPDSPLSAAAGGDKHERKRKDRERNGMGGAMAAGTVTRARTPRTIN